jgi:hypothetical protein
MTADGYAFIAKEGAVPVSRQHSRRHLFSSTYAPRRVRIRPDDRSVRAWRSKDDGDIATPHTKHQLQVFANTINRGDGATLGAILFT